MCSRNDDVLDLPGLYVKPSSNRCPESFFERSGLWPARRLPLPSVCSAWFYELQLFAALGRHRIVHSGRWRSSDSGHVDGEGDRGGGPRGLVGARIGGGG